MSIFPADRLHVVFGAGPLGLAVAEAARASGGRVRLVSRSGPARPVPGVETVAADATDPAAVRAVCRGADVVYQCAAPAYHRWAQAFPTLQRAILGAAAGAGAVFVVAENLYGYGVAGRLGPDLPMRAATRKGRVRAEMTAALFDAHRHGDVRAVAVRASDFFGPGVRLSALGARFWPALLEGRPIGWFGDPDALHSFTYVPDFATALVRAGAEEKAWGRAWHAPSPEALSLRAIAARAAARAGLPAPPIRRTRTLSMRVAGLFSPAARETVEMGYSYEADFVIDDAAYRATFGGVPVDWDAALEATLDWWRASASSRPIDPAGLAAV